MAQLPQTVQISDTNILSCTKNGISGIYMAKSAYSHSQLVANLTRLTQLEVLYLNGGSMTGTLNPQVFAMPSLKYLHLGKMNFTGAFPETSTIEYLSITDNQQPLSLPNNFTKWARLRELNASNNMIYGPLSPTIGSLKNLTYLDLTNNHLTGQLPSSLGDLSSNLRMLDVRHNDLVGPIPDAIAKMKLYNTFGFDAVLFSPTGSTASSSSSPVLTPTVIGMIAGLVLVVGAVALLVHRKQRTLQRPDDGYDMGLSRDDASNDTLFAMNLVINKKLEGKGGAGAVYTALFGNCKCVAKIPLKKDHEYMLYQEMQMMDRFDSPYILKKLGFISGVELYLEEEIDRKPRCALVLEWMNLGSMNQYLSKKLDERTLLVMASRPRLCLQIARGLKAMHDLGWCHLDIKGDNVLLNLDTRTLEVNAKISDFGSMMQDGAVGQTLLTPGFIAPEASANCPKTKAFDVYAFGALLSKIVTVQNMPARWLQTNANFDAKKKSLEMVGVTAEMTELLLGCLQPKPSQRWTIDMVIERLEQMPASAWEVGMLRTLSMAQLTRVYQELQTEHMSVRKPMPSSLKMSYGSSVEFSTVIEECLSYDQERSLEPNLLLTLDQRIEQMFASQNVVYFSKNKGA
ncbi:hypothetical protein HDV03_000021 [Kappamyces sp. JEL0829]|nr:hypothetical protein HDV03_000021 [Kappamyces sp. JEL0829]